jgi:hypothetical protein
MYVKSCSMAANENPKVMADTVTVVEMRRSVQPHVCMIFEITTVMTANIAFFWACDAV